jgi:hypothetical protein
MVNKHIRSIFLLNESKSFAVIKPLNNSIRHDTILLLRIFKNFKLEDAIEERGYPAEKNRPEKSVRAVLNDITITACEEKAS